jgi:molybdopterin converting factor subunit 1
VNINLLCFGITRDITGSAHVQLEIPDNTRVAALRHLLAELYPALCSLSSLMIAVNEEYANDDVLLTPDSEIALIPPVSGG